MKNILMGEMTVKEVREYLTNDKKTIIVPYGVVEQHGYHLPLDTDIRNSEIMGRKIAEELGCLVAPTLNYCFSGGMLEGTINVRPNTFATLMCEIVESLALQGFENIIIIPGHGGSESLVNLKESLRVAKWLNRALDKCLLMFIPLWDFSPTWLNLFKNRDFHAGNAETSLMMHLSPEVVRKDIVMDSPEISEMMRNDPDSFQVRSLFTGMKHEIPTTTQNPEIRVGVMGYPESASVETGRKMFEEILENSVRAIREAVSGAEEARKTGKMIVDDKLEKMKILSL
ncbi:MAG: hypothetical protein A2020_00185 [Lentisphaerae bacterium GWF2_45_14]|nr:MAG: hypothetical protein A2020_00185 [Lentisphaerae bacterium GWF2_45_14]